MEKEISIQSHKSIHNFLNQMMHNKRKIKEYYKKQLDKIKIEHEIEAQHLSKKNEINHSYEKANVFELNIENEIIKVKKYTKNLKIMHDFKEKLIDETINGVVSIFKITNVEEDFKENGFQRDQIENAIFEYENVRNKDPGVISQLLLVISKRLWHAMHICEIDLIHDSKVLNETGFTMQVTDNSIKITDLKKMLQK